MWGDAETRVPLTHKTSHQYHSVKKRSPCDMGTMCVSQFMCFTQGVHSRLTSNLDSSLESEGWDGCSKLQANLS